MKSNPAAACYKRFSLTPFVMNDRRRFTCAFVLGLCINLLLLIAGDLLFLFSKQDLHIEKETASVVHVVLGRSIQKNLSLPQTEETEQHEIVPETEQRLPSNQTNQITEEKNILPQQEIIEAAESLTIQDQTPSNYSDAASGENIFSETAEATEIITGSNVVSSSEISAEAERNKLYEMIYALIEEKKQYPPLARRRNIEGRVGVTIRISAAGNLQDSSIASSAGNSILDQAAVNLIKSIFPLNIDLHSETELTVTISYSLKD